MTTSKPSLEPSTISDTVALLAGLGWGLALSGALRWGPRHKKVRAFSVPVGLNLGAALTALTVVFSALDASGLGWRWDQWWPVGLVSLVLATVGFRFPRTGGLGLVALCLALAWGGMVALKDFRPLTSNVPPPRVQPMSDRELVTLFALVLDEVDVPLSLPGVADTWYRVRPEGGAAPELWWTAAESFGWAKTYKASGPSQPMKYGIYRLVVGDEGAQWKLEVPQLLP